MTSSRADSNNCPHCGAGISAGANVCTRCRRSHGGETGLPVIGNLESISISRVDNFVIKAMMWAAITVSILLVPVSVLLFVYGTHPGRHTPLGWTLQTVLMGAGFGILGGIIIGAIIGVLLGGIYETVGEIRVFVTRRRKRKVVEIDLHSGVRDREFDA